jgi:aspartate/methionine/tyrosine aminotransferase
VRENLISLISDEIYHGLQYEGPAVSALEVTDEVYVINSFSKYFSMTGWRLGWMVVPPDHVRRVERSGAEHVHLPRPCQARSRRWGRSAPRGAPNWMNIASHMPGIARILLEGLQGAGLTNTAPADGAFYVYVDVGHLTDDSRALAARILEEAGVAVTPGLDFDKGRGHRTLRLSYARGTAEIEEGVARLTRFFAGG